MRRMLYIYTYLGLGLGRYFHSERCRRDFGVVHLCTYFKETDEGKVAMKGKLLPTLPFKLKLIKLKIETLVHSQSSFQDLARVTR